MHQLTSDVYMDTAFVAQKPRQSPYDQLFIYYLKGRVKPNAEPIGRHFLGTWQEDGDAFLFFSGPSMPEVTRLLEMQPHLDLIDSYHMSYAQWIGGQLKTMRIGPFMIVPPWHDPNGTTCADPPQHTITLDPGVVFGTGLHPTTADCLTALVSVFRRCAIQTALDIGTGTGLLALAAARLGSRRVLALDTNRLATRTAHRNVGLNRLNDRVVVIQASAEDFAGQSADLLIANIHYDVILKMIRLEQFYQDRFVIFSGLLRSQFRHLTSELTRRCVRLISDWSQDGAWHTMLVRVKSPNARLTINDQPMGSPTDAY